MDRAQPDAPPLVLPAHLMDLPCIIEAQKTFDKTTYYKAADISQVQRIHWTFKFAAHLN